jgi:hypothetical protein
LLEGLVIGVLVGDYFVGAGANFRIGERLERQLILRQCRWQARESESGDGDRIGYETAHRNMTPAGILKHSKRLQEYCNRVSGQSGAAKEGG